MLPRLTPHRPPGNRCAMAKRLLVFVALLLAGTAVPASRGGAGTAEPWDNFSDTWAATDALGRALPMAAEAGRPRADRTVGLFYFLWHGAHARGGPYDISRILAADPQSMTKPESPLWGPLHVPHH